MKAELLCPSLRKSPRKLRGSGMSKIHGRTTSCCSAQTSVLTRRPRKPKPPSRRKQNIGCMSTAHQLSSKAGCSAKAAPDPHVHNSHRHEYICKPGHNEFRLPFYLYGEEMLITAPDSVEFLRIFKLLVENLFQPE